MEEKDREGGDQKHEEEDRPALQVEEPRDLEAGLGGKVQAGVFSNGCSSGCYPRRLPVTLSISIRITTVRARVASG